MSICKNLHVALVDSTDHFIDEVVVPEMLFSWAKPEINRDVYKIVLKYKGRYFYYDSIQAANPKAGRPIFKEAKVIRVS